MKRRKRAKNFVISSLLISLVLMIISPWISLFASLLLVGAASWGVTLTGDLGYNPRRDVYNTELDKIKNSGSEYSELIIMMALFLSIFFLSIFLLYLGWNGLLSYLFT
ncbi:hypothetical protein Aboo_0354 [Aciduliprofundum boonei T469]|uniref:Phosphatidate cytidylyltransferase n=2 Tax=Candidatus Aciduliprofundum boonei TaxID=379547 RepID=B5IDT5_ACIB4|nr:hypothetical protein Aboo_0354 [Aciduliprofundum boonei T469]EDY35651.1 hypothetical protein ABOONEI_188 [Aciduliprofundum boonei T469]HII54540.1 hypothetical protein [Candidatus Aciduliprofundum boonei]